MYSIKVDNLNLDQIAKSGQAFRFKEVGKNHFSVIAFNRYLEIVQNGSQFSFSCTEEEFESIWRDYFDFSTDYSHIASTIISSGDDYLINAYNNGSGVRILKQDLWEIIITFMISQNNNISRIKKSVDLLCTAGHVPCINREDKYAFPSAKDISFDIFSDKSLGFGYRSEYLKDMFAFATENPNWLNKLKTLNYEDAMKELLAIKGIGNKVANCICLFGLHHVDAFPIDTHVRQILDAHYPDGFDFNRYSGFSGIVQQYMFYDKISIKK